MVIANPAKDYKGVKILDGLNGALTKYALNQVITDRDIKQTGLNQHLWYYFDGK